MSNLAVVIPAYKANYLDECLSSFIAQTNQNFKLYIFNDNSPQNIDTIVKPYLDARNVFYHKFKSNVGGKSLIKHWARCIEQTSEEWIWLFSDDDRVSKNCVELFYQNSREHKSQDFFRFEKITINKNGDELGKEPFSLFESQEEFYNSIVLKKYSVTLPEYVFKRKLYESQNGFVDFDLAWGSDKATWINFSSVNGIRTIQNAQTYFRMSGENISSINDKSLFTRKLKARIAYYQWHKKQKKISFIHDGTSSIDYVRNSVLWYIQSHITFSNFSELIELVSLLKSGLSLSRSHAIYFLLKSKYAKWKNPFLSTL